MPDQFEVWLESDIAKYIQYYIEQGFSVFPAHGVTSALRCTCGKYPCGENNKSAGKHPITHNGFKDACTDIEAVAELFNYRTDLNIAIATGNSSGFFVVDIDERTEGSGEDELHNLQEENGQLPPTLTSITGSGHHLLFKQPNDFDVRNGKIAPHIDIRGTGGYVIVPPSRHYSGKNYSFDSLCDTIAEAPEWLLNMLRPKTKPVQDITHDYTSGFPQEWSKEEVWRMLDYLDPDMSYQDWLNVGFALHSGGYPLSTWDDWSRGGQKYQNGDCEKRWREFHA